MNYVVHDYYYHDLSHKSLEERALTNFDHPDSLETTLLLEHVRALKNSTEACRIPTYDFATHCRRDVQEHLTMEPRKVVLVEGILLFCNPELVNEFDVKVYVVSTVRKLFVYMHIKFRMRAFEILESLKEECCYCV